MVFHFMAASEPKPPEGEQNGHPMWIFICAYIGMVPAANLVGFAGQELARKIPKVIGVILETTFGSLVEIILFIVLIVGGNKNVPVIQAAILGSILANMLLCLGTCIDAVHIYLLLILLLGFCFFVGGVFRPQQTFHEAISEVGSNLMLVAGLGLIIPTIYYNSLQNQPLLIEPTRLNEQTLNISHATAIVLLAAFLIYLWFQARSHHGLYEDILEADEERDHDRHKDLAKAKLTFTESIMALLLALTFVSLMAVFLVQQIEFMVIHKGISDHFMGLILVPVVEKASEHLTAVDEAYDNQMNFALAHVLGASIQTALLNTPIVVIVGWGLGTEMGLNFQIFDAVILILAIIVVGNFLRDEKSDYLEGVLCVFVYVLVAVTAWYFPNPPKVQEEIEHLKHEAAASAAEHAARMFLAN
jgi:Ca2+:H+ antiporter